MTRKYELKKRADGQAETRARIIEATVELHEQLARSRRRSVRSPNEPVFSASPFIVISRTSEPFSRPAPDTGLPATPSPIPPSGRHQRPRRTAAACARRDLQLLPRNPRHDGNLLRDLPSSVVLQEVAAPFIEYWDTVRDVLSGGWNRQGRKRKLLHAIIGHAIEFETWRSLTHRQHLNDNAAAETMVTLARAI